MNLLDQWNEHIVRGNQLSRELEDFEGIMHVADISESKVAIAGGGGTTYIDRVLPPDKMAEIKGMVISSLANAKAEKERELKKLMGLWKPAIIKPEFEAAVQGMDQSGKKQPDPVEEKLTEILQEEAKRIEELPVPLKPSEILEQKSEEIEKMYKVQMSTVGAIAEKYRVKKTDVNTFLAKHKLFRTTRKDDGFLDAKVQARQSKGC
jgi:hypothetical protein